mgnify:CR=1 FL=1
MLSWFINNKEWIFSGIGIFILGLFIRRAFKNKVQRSGKNSINLMADRDINYNSATKKKKDD